jgi:hypothetical protein
MRDDYDWRADSVLSWALAIRAKREAAIRSGRLPALTPDEARQAAEGPQDWRNLDCVRAGR